MVRGHDVEGAHHNGGFYYPHSASSPSSILTQSLTDFSSQTPSTTTTNMNALVAISVTLVASTFWLIQRYRRSSYKLPPGPRGWPIIGNLFDMPHDYHWVTYSEWGKKYGPLTYLNVVGSPILIINSQRVALDLLEKRGQSYAGRPRSVMMELVGQRIFRFAYSACC